MKWTAKQDAILRRFYPHKTVREIQTMFRAPKPTRNMIIGRANRLGLTGQREVSGRARVWTIPEELRLVLLKRLGFRHVDIARATDRTVHAIDQRSSDLGLRKPPSATSPLIA